MLLLPIVYLYYVNQSVSQYSFNYGMTECRPNTENEQYANTQIKC